MGILLYVQCIFEDNQLEALFYIPGPIILKPAEISFCIVLNGYVCYVYFYTICIDRCEDFYSKMAHPPFEKDG